MKKILYNEEIISIVVDLKEVKEGLDFFSSDEDFIQVGTWNYEKGKTLPLHYHNKFERTSYRTSESVYVVKGKVECNLFTENGEFIEKVVLEEGQLIIQLSQAHEYIILEDSVVLEVKNGPYFGPDKDRTRIDKI